MEKLGEIVAILNSTRLLVQLEGEDAAAVKPGEKYTVFSKVERPEIKALGLSEIYSPKGSIRIVMHQSDNFFLAERYLEGGRVEQRPIAAIEGLFTREVKVGGTWSANIDEQSSLGVEFETQIKAGDILGSL